MKTAFKPHLLTILILSISLVPGPVTADLENENIKTAVIDSLKDDPPTSSIDCYVVIRDGVFHKRESRKPGAEVSGFQAIGVRSVVNLLRVTPLTKPDDGEIREYLALRLQSNPWVSDEMVKSTVKDGVVSFHGAVDSLSERSRLIAMAEIYGVSEIVADDLVASPELRARMERPHPPIFRTDEQIRETLEDTIYQDYRVDGGNIEVSVLDGDITLMGTVNSIGARVSAERIAMDLPGAADVYSFLRVKSDLDIGDDEIETSLERIFRSDAVLADAGISVNVKDQIVELEGMVDAVWHRRRAVRIAANQWGVRRVTSRLRVDWDSEENSAE